MILISSYSGCSKNLQSGWPADGYFANERLSKNFLVFKLSVPHQALLLLRQSAEGVNAVITSEWHALNVASNKNDWAIVLLAIF